MGRAIGANSLLDIAFESSFGTIPNAGYKRVPFVSGNLGAEQGLEEDDLLGTGREVQDPTDGVVNNDGDLTVPVDARAFGHWLKLFLGLPVTTADDDLFEHVFTSGASALPSLTVQVGQPDVPNYEKNYGMSGNTMRISMARGGKLNAVLGLVGKGSTDASTSSSGTPTTVEADRFMQATGSVKKDGVLLGSVVSADITYTNNQAKVETIQPDGEIEGVDALKTGATIALVTKFANTTLLTAAQSGDPIDLEFGWTKGDFSLIFSLPRVFLPRRSKKPVTGPAGIQVSFNLIASGQGGHALTATLINDVASYV